VNLDRNFIGCEVSEEYFKKSIARLENTFQKKAKV